MREVPAEASAPVLLQELRVRMLRVLPQGREQVQGREQAPALPRAGALDHLARKRLCQIHRHDGHELTVHYTVNIEVEGNCHDSFFGAELGKLTEIGLFNYVGSGSGDIHRSAQKI